MEIQNRLNNLNRQKMRMLCLRRIRISFWGMVKVQQLILGGKVLLVRLELGKTNYNASFPS